MVMTSVWLHDRSSCKLFGKVLQKRFEVKQTGHIGFGVNDKKELKILNRRIKIDALNDEMTLEADTKLVENALESMKLNGAKGVDSPRVRRNEEQIAQIENSEDSRQRSRLCTAVWAAFADSTRCSCSWPHAKPASLWRLLLLPQHSPRM